MPASAATDNDPAKVIRLLADQRRRRKEIPIDRSLLDGYVGYYQLTPYSIANVTRESDHLMVGFTGESSVEVYPESPQKFFFKNVAAQVSFLTDAQGRATTLVLHQIGVERMAPRIDQARAHIIEAALAKRIKEATAVPGTEGALRRQIELLRARPTRFRRYVERFGGDRRLGTSAH